jgi:hypothetical protein
VVRSLCRLVRPVIATRLTLAALFALSWGLFAAAPGFAGGNSSTPCVPGPQETTCTYTQNVHGAVQSFPSNVPCVDPPNSVTGFLTLTSNAVFHETVNTAGDDWFTSTQTGDFSFVSFDPAALSYTGHFETWFGGSFNQNNSVLHDTFHVHGTASDGSSLTAHMLDHMSISASGITLVFDKIAC